MLARLAMWYSAWILRLGQRDQWYSWCLHFCGQRESLLVGFRGAWCFPRRSRNYGGWELGRAHGLSSMCSRYLGVGESSFLHNSALLFPVSADAVPARFALR